MGTKLWLHLCWRYHSAMAAMRARQCDYHAERAEKIFQQLSGDTAK